jgi:hypothetical protein
MPWSSVFINENITLPINGRLVYAIKESNQLTYGLKITVNDDRVMVVEVVDAFYHSFPLNPGISISFKLDARASHLVSTLIHR